MNKAQLEDYKKAGFSVESAEALEDAPHGDMPVVKSESVSEAPKKFSGEIDEIV